MEGSAAMGMRTPTDYCFPSVEAIDVASQILDYNVPIDVTGRKGGEVV